MDPPASCKNPSPGSAPIRRLTRFEYSNTIRDLLGDTTQPGDFLPAEVKGNGFSNDAASATSTRLLIDAYHSVAHDIAARATAPTAMAKLSTCDTVKTGEEACAQAFINDFGARAFRHPLESAESAAMMSIYKIGRQGAAHADGLAAVIEMALQSPQFLYRVEYGLPVVDKTVTQPTPYELATRLSYILWSSMPDAELMDAARNGNLANKDQVLVQAKRLLKSPRARDVTRYFHNTLLGINGLDGLQRSTEWFPTYTPDMAALFRQETEHFVDYVVWDGSGDFKTLMTGSFSFMNEKLAKFYGVTGVTGDAFRKVDLDPTRRAGPLTQASVLTATTPGSHNNPVVRGKFITQNLLCGTVNDPPPGLMVTEPPVDTTRTTRERFVAHRTSATCAGCHVALDAIGFGLEHYNGVGLWQDTDNNKQIDSSGVITDTDAAGEFNGAIELANKLASSQDAQSCFVGKWSSFAYGRSQGDDDECTMYSLRQAFTKSNGNVRELLLALTQTDAFLYRPVAQQ